MKTSYSFTFDKPITSPGTILVSTRHPSQVISDSRGNAFALASNNPGRWHRRGYGHLITKVHFPRPILPVAAPSSLATT